MNDTITKRLNPSWSLAADLKDFSFAESQALASNTGLTASEATLKRNLADLTKAGILSVSGKGRGTRYTLATKGRLLLPLDAKSYVDTEPDRRGGHSRFDRELFPSLPNDIFTDDELRRLTEATEAFHRQSRAATTGTAKKELERLVIELSWKSSKIEGNTYTLLDTEKLLIDHVAAPNHTRSETQMILNHKSAFDYILQADGHFNPLTRRAVEDVHSLLVRDLGVATGLRRGPVGVSGSVYRPLDNAYQIGDALKDIIDAVNRTSTPYAGSLIALLGIAYLQPFEDGNKRASRLVANALLLANKLAPLSYRSVDEEEYRAAMLVFYERHSIQPLKKIFIEQYEFACAHYALAL